MTTPIIFQSTRPIRGATISVNKQRAQTRISIHAPHTGRDAARHCCGGWTRPFQSTRPIRGATIMSIMCPWDNSDFNPRAPYGARRLADHVGQDGQRISIHAPHTGRDPSKAAARSLGAYFNPRAPYGARLPSLPPAARRRRFQSTRPIRGATRVRCLAGSDGDGFQSTRPIRGATKVFIMQNVTPLFQSTRPIRGATPTTTRAIPRVSGFQSTRPIRGATRA